MNRTLEDRLYLLRQAVLELEETETAWNDYYGRDNAPADQAHRMKELIELIGAEYKRVWDVLQATTILSKTELEYIFNDVQP